MPGPRPIDVNQFSGNINTLKSSITAKNQNQFAIKTLGLSQFANTTTTQLQTVVPNFTGSGSLVFNSSPILVSPSFGNNHTTVLTNTVETYTTTANQILMQFPMYSMSNNTEVYGSADIVIHVSVGNTTNGSFPESVIQKRIAKILALFDNDTDWELNPFPPIQDQDRSVYHTEYATISSSGYGSLSSVCSFNIILNTANLTYDLVVTPSTTNYMRFKVLSTCLISDDLYFNPVVGGV